MRGKTASDAILIRAPRRNSRAPIRIARLRV